MKKIIREDKAKKKAKKKKEHYHNSQMGRKNFWIKDETLSQTDTDQL